ncbi:MAG: hypothetical protein IE889_06005 [Campylobacterales bacterium]|nr:hypothetical protein [Campylobacterales bacterium]
MGKAFTHYLLFIYFLRTHILESLEDFDTIAATPLDTPQSLDNILEAKPLPKQGILSTTLPSPAVPAENTAPCIWVKEKILQQNTPSNWLGNIRLKEGIGKSVSYGYRREVV